MLLRAATPEDADAIAAIQAACWQHAYSDLLPAELIAAWIGGLPGRWRRRLAGRSQVTVLTAEDRVAGFTEIENAHLWALFVHPAFWGRGIGDRLFEDAAERCGPGLYLRTLRENWPARRFYESRGMTVAAEMNDVFFDYEAKSVLYVWPPGVTAAAAVPAA